MEAKPRIMLKEEDLKEALRLLGWAQFNLAKGKIGAAQILIDKALISLGSEPWYNHYEELLRESDGLIEQYEAQRATLAKIADLSEGRRGRNISEIHRLATHPLASSPASKPNKDNFKEKYGGLYHPLYEETL